MPSPVVPSEFCALTPTPGTDPCEAVKRLFFEQPALLCSLLEYMFDEDGNPTDEFLRDTNPVPVGTVLMHSGLTPPAGFLLCNGQQVSRTTYADLFAVIGTLYGEGDGATTFAVPDLRQKFVAGHDPADVDFAVGFDGGDTDVTLVAANIPPHVHTSSLALNAQTLIHNGAFGIGYNTSFSSQNDHIGDGDNTVGYGVLESIFAELDEINGTQTPTPIEVMPPYMALQMVIKY